MKINKSNIAGEFWFIMLQIMIYLGPEVVGQATCYPSFLMKDELNTSTKIKFKLFTKNKEAREEPFLYSYLPREARLGINIWAVNTDLEMVCLGSAGTTVFDQNGIFKSHFKSDENDSANFEHSEEIKEVDIKAKNKSKITEVTLWPLKQFSTDVSWFGCNHTSEANSPMFTTYFKFENFKKPMKYNREYDETKHKDEIYKFSM